MPPPTDPDHHLELPPAHLVLMPERAVFEPASHTLFVADIHLGKAAVFRARGIPVPHGTSGTTLERISQAVARSGATRLVVLGDFLHAKESQARSTMAALAAWRSAHAGLSCLVVEGNHDRHAGQVQSAFGFETLGGPYVAGALRCVHDPADAPVPGLWTLAGHVHPVVRLRGRHDSLRMPCFWLRDRVLTLPAFGEFTGGFELVPGAQDRVFVVGEQVVALPAAPHRSSRKPIAVRNTSK
jgi:DNA ligase-associated metallophosphoesterase